MGLVNKICTFFRNKNNTKSCSFNKLTPETDADIGSYKEALDFSLAEKELLNIAITGPYGSGKSSIIKSYEKQCKCKKFKYVSLAYFEKINDERKYDELEMEGKILNQLIHQIDYNKIPQTNFRIKPIVSKRTILIESLFMLLGILLALYIFAPSVIPFFNSIPDQILGINTNTVAFIIFAGLIFLLIHDIIKVQSHKHIFKRAKILNHELEMENKKDESYFDKHLDEILYLLKRANIDAIIFEDIDRHNSNLLFIKLREINFLINQSLDGKTLKFYYLLRDDTFLSKDRTKFFDFIIPIVPIIDNSNSYNKMKEYIDNCKLEGIDDMFLKKISLYIDDMRLVKNILNEYQIYKKTISNIKLDQNKMLAMIVYKNIFPKDFHNTQFGKGYIYDVFQNKDSLLLKFNHTLLEDYKKQIADIENKIEISGKEWAENLAEFDKVNKYAIAHGDQINNVNHRRAHLAKQGELTKSEYTSELETKHSEIENKIRKIKSSKLCEVIDKRSDIFNPKTCKDEYKEEVVCDHYFGLIKHLLCNGHIDESYQDYLTHFYPNSLSIRDKNFILSLSNNTPEDCFYIIDNTALVLSYLNEADFSNIGILNFSLINEIFKTRHNYCNHIITLLKEKKRTDVIIEYLSTSHEKIYFIQLVAENWIEFLHESLLHNNKKDKHRVALHFIIEHINIDIIQKMNINNCIVEFINNDYEFLNYNSRDIQKVDDIFDNLKIRFLQIDFHKSNAELFRMVYNNSYYDINITTVLTILKNIYKISTIDESKLYTLISSKPDEPLKHYIDLKINDFFAMCLLNRKFADSLDNAISLLNSNNLTKERKVYYIEHLETSIPLLNDISDPSLWKHIISNSITPCNSENIIEYFHYTKKFDKEIADFININEHIEFDYKQLDENKKLDSFLSGIINCNELLDDKYRYFLRGLNRTYENFTFQNISKDKMNVLIDLEIIEITNVNLTFIRENYIDNIKQFISKNINTYIDLVKDSPDLIEQSELLYILDEPNYSIDIKKSAVEISPEPLSVSNHSYYEWIELHILKKNFDINDLPNLLNSFYDEKNDEIKAQIQSLCVSNITYALNKEHSISFELLKSILNSADIPNKHKLLIHYLQQLNKAQIIECLNIIKAFTLIELLNGKSKRKIEKTPENDKYLSFFIDNSWIKSFSEKNGKYQAK